MQIKIIESKKDWDKALSRFKKLEKYDFYHEFDYQNLYEDKDAKISSFYFEDDENIFFFPYLKKKINSSNLSDFETAYGYGGPISSTDNTDFINKAWENFFSYAHREKFVAGLIRFHPLLSSKEITKPR